MVLSLSLSSWLVLSVTHNVGRPVADVPSSNSTIRRASTSKKGLKGGQDRRYASNDEIAHRARVRVKVRVRVRVRVKVRVARRSLNDDCRNKESMGYGDICGGWRYD